MEEKMIYIPTCAELKIGDVLEAGYTFDLEEARKMLANNMKQTVPRQNDCRHKRYAYFIEGYRVPTTGTAEESFFDFLENEIPMQPDFYEETDIK